MSLKSKEKQPKTPQPSNFSFLAGKEKSPKEKADNGGSDVAAEVRDQSVCEGNAGCGGSDVAAKGNAPMPEISRFQRFRVERVPRSMLKEAPYNPRIMDEHGHKLLNKSLKKSGLVETIVWNKRTGNVVGGHQRLSELDKLESGKEYSLDVAVIDVDETEEREINIKLNNQNMMGAYDAEKLASLFIQDGVQFADTGFSSLDIQLNFDTPVANAILGTDREEEPEVVSDIETIQKIKAARKQGKERANHKNSPEHFKVIVFNSMESMDEFIDYFGIDGETRYIDGEIIKSKMGIERRETRDERRETRDERRETRDERRETRTQRRETGAVE